MKTKLTKKQLAKLSISNILDKGEFNAIRNLFVIDKVDDPKEILFKFSLWSRWFFPNFFLDDDKENISDAEFHKTMDENNLRVYQGNNQYFVNVAFRGSGKSTRTKLFIAFCIANDFNHFRKFIKVLSKDAGNSRQFVTDIYNFFVSKKMKYYYPEVFDKTAEKRMESMSEFDTATGIKVRAGTVGQEQRGQIADDNRPDFIIFDDFETRDVLRSAIKLQAIWDNMEEARTGLSKTGGAVYLCNYLSERGNVHKLITKYPSLLIPIKGKIETHSTGDNIDVRWIDGEPSWIKQYNKQETENILKLADDPAGEYLSCPAVGEDVYYPREQLDKMEKRTPVDVIAGFKKFYEYDPSHRYGSGHDVAGGLGLDHSTSVFIDFTQFPARVVGTFKSNTIKPDIFGDEINAQRKHFGTPIIAVENNRFDMTIGVLKGKYDNLYVMREKETKAGITGAVRQWGWNTNSVTKSTMMTDLRKAIKDGHLELSDPDLIAEARAYSRDDLMDREADPRLATRHFDLLTACAIAWQMRNYAEISENKEAYQQGSYKPMSEYEAKGINSNLKTSLMFNGQPIPFEQPPYQSPSEFGG